jgi:HAD superfamily hydrolase (TIGR01549 family)
MREKFGVTTGLAASNDPFDVLRYIVSNLAPSEAVRAEYELTTIETEAIRLAPPTADAHSAIRHLAERGTVAIVSNNSTSAIREYLRLHGLTDDISVVSGRYSEDVALLKPNAHLLNLALLRLGANPAESCFVGDSVFDMQAAHAASVVPIAFAAKPGRAAELAAHSPTATLTSMTELLAA